MTTVYYRTDLARQLSNIQPQDGVFRLETALEQIEGHLNNIPPDSDTFLELSHLQRTYNGYLKSARELREKGMASFRKYQKLKNSNSPSPSSETANKKPNVVNEKLVQSQSSSPPDTKTVIPAQNKNVTQIKISVQQLMDENKRLQTQIEELLKNKAENEEMEQELRLINETYKYTQLSDKQQINNLKNTVATYKKALNQKSKTLDTLNNEYETIKANNALITKQNDQLQEQLSQSLAENTKLKQQIIEKNMEFELLSKENNDLSSKLSLSQQLNSPQKSKPDSNTQKSAKQEENAANNEQNIDNDTEEQMRRISALLMAENTDLQKIKDEFSTLMEKFHPINLSKTAKVSNTPSDTQSFELVNGNAEQNGKYVLTQSEYKDIERCIDERDKYFEKVNYYQQSLSNLSAKYDALQQRFSQINEEKSLMMQTLKRSVEMLSNDNNAMKEKLASMNEERSNIKEHDLKTQNDFYKIFEENKERKFEMESLQKQIKALMHDTETYKYLSQQLKEQNVKINQNLSDSLERIEKLVEDKEIISKKLRESNKLTMELLKERTSINTPSESKKLDEVKEETEADAVEEEVEEDWRKKYEKVVIEKMEFEQIAQENDGTVNELTNQIIALEQRLQSLEVENELLRKEISAISADNARKTNQILSAQRVALSIMQSNKEGKYNNMNDANVRNVSRVQKDMFGLQPPPEPDLITSLLTYLLPFLFEEDDQPKIV